MSYGFTIKDCAEFDFSRIENEAQGDAGFVVMLRNSANAVVALRPEFLARFDYGDKVMVAGEELYPSWGASTDVAINSCHRLELRRCRHALRTRAVLVPKGEIPTVISEIRAAKAYNRKITVRVVEL